MFSFYADESGSADIHNHSQPWFVLLAIGFNDDHWVRIDEGVTALKKAYFPSWNLAEIEIHSNDIRRAPLQAFPPNPFSTLSAGKLAQFGQDLYDLIDSLPFEWCASALDKQATIVKHGLTTSSELFKFAYMLLVERLHGWCTAEQNVGRLFVDQQEHNLIGATHDLIKRDHFQLREQGTGWVRPTAIIERPYFQDSSRSQHMQLADVLAYNVYRRCVSNDASYSYFLKTLRKVRGNCRPDGGYYGLKIYP